MSEMKTHVRLNDKEMVQFKSLKTMLEAERELKPSDMDAIALVCINLSMIDAALDNIDCHGHMIETNTNYGSTVKSNPAIQVLDNAQKNLRALMGELLMSPKSKMMVTKEISKKTDDEDDPIAALIKNKAKRGA